MVQMIDPDHAVILATLSADEHERAAEACWAMARHWVLRATAHKADARAIRNRVARLVRLLTPPPA